MFLTTIYLRRSCAFPLSLSAADTFASYHTNNVLSSWRNPAEKRLRKARNYFQPKHAVSGDTATEQKKLWSKETSLLKNVKNRGTASSELKKLSLDDHTVPKKNLTVKQKARNVDLKEDSYEFVFGVSPCLLAITQGRRKICSLFVKDGQTSIRASVLQVCEEAYRHGVPIHRVSKKDMDKMAPGRVHQGVCLQASPLTYITEEMQSWPFPRKDQILWLVLESIQDPMNLGAILRSAYFLGVDRVVSNISQSCPLSPVVSKASSGVMEVMEVYGCKDLGEMLKMKVTRGWEVVGTVGSESQESNVTKCSDFTMTKPTLLLIGGEGGGLTHNLLSLCQTLVTIPAGRQLFSGIESLNVSVATGILVHSLLFSRSSNKLVS